MSDESTRTRYHLPSAGWLSAEDRATLLAIAEGTERNGRLLHRILQELSPMRAEIQALVAVVGPLVTAVQALETQSAAETQTIADLTAKLAAGTALAPDEVQALADAASSLSSLTQSAVAAVAPVPAAAQAATAAASAPQPQG